MIFSISKNFAHINLALQPFPGRIASMSQILQRGKETEKEG